MKAFFGLILGLAIPILIVAFLFRMNGLSQKYQALDHPLNSENLLYIAYQGGSGEHPANTWEAIDSTLSLNPAFTLWLDVHQTKDGVLVLFGPDMLESQTEGQGHIGLQEWSYVQKLNAGFHFQGAEKTYTIHTLEKTLQRYPKARFIFNVRANAPKIDLRLAELFEKYKVVDRAIFTSPFEVVTKTLRKAKPLGMYAMGLAEFTRLHMFSSLGLGPAIPLKGDIFVSPRKLYQRSLSSDLIQEIQRRKKKVVVAVETLDDWKKWSNVKVDGWITRFPSRFSNLIIHSGVQQ